MTGNLQYRRDSEISRPSSTDIYLPSCIFNSKLSSYETIVKFLKEGYNLTLQRIAKLLGKKKQSVWRAYKQAAEKHPESLPVINLYYPIQVSIFKISTCSLLEAIVIYLKDHYKLRFSQISILLMRDYKTVWTAYHRASKKERYELTK